MPDEPQPAEAVKVFFSYAHEDAELRLRLEQHFSFLKREKKIAHWYDGEIRPGKDWRGEIEEHLNAADVILLLISAAFAHSDFCYNIETGRAMERHNAGEAVVVPIILHPCDWRSAPFANLQALPGGAAISEWANTEKALYEVAKGVREVVEALIFQRVDSQPDPAGEEAAVVAYINLPSAEGAAELDERAARRRTSLGDMLAMRPLHFVWIVDCSSSMREDGKIQALNNSIREAIPHLRSTAHENPRAQMLVSAVSFSSGARWHVATPTPVEDFRWDDLTAGGARDMGAALRLVAEALHMPPMSERAFPPLLVLISDGPPTDDFRGGLKRLLDEYWGKRAMRLAVAFGEGADLRTLQEFIGDPELRPLRANDMETLGNYIKWISANSDAW